MGLRGKRASNLWGRGARQVDTNRLSTFRALTHLGKNGNRGNFVCNPLSCGLVADRKGHTPVTKFPRLPECFQGG